MTRSQPLWWWTILAALFAGSAVTPLAISRAWMLPLLWVWPLLIFSPLRARAVGGCSTTVRVERDLWLAAGHRLTLVQPRNLRRAVGGAYSTIFVRSTANQDGALRYANAPYV